MSDVEGIRSSCCNASYMDSRWGSFCNNALRVVLMPNPPLHNCPKHGLETCAAFASKRHVCTNPENEEDQKIEWISDE